MQVNQNTHEAIIAYKVVNSARRCQSLHWKQVESICGRMEHGKREEARL